MRKREFDFDEGCLQYEKLRDLASSGMWKFQGCGLIFHEEWKAYLHKGIINYSSTMSNLIRFNLW
jgi:hypothetical protein